MDEIDSLLDEDAELFTAIQNLRQEILLEQVELAEIIPCGENCVAYESGMAINVTDISGLEGLFYELSGLNNEAREVYEIFLAHKQEMEAANDGMDINTPANTPVYSVYGGIVSDARWVSGYGNYIQIEHKDGLSSFYAHLNMIEVKKGDVVKKGEEIGKSGNTGIGTGPHLHFGVKKNGKSDNPTKYLPKF